jgi:dihydroxyacetone kinase phosphoprotein-dependent L subunit
MESPSLTVDGARHMLLFAAGRFIEHQDVLTQADRAIGDGDHGVGMARGFEAVQRALEPARFNTLEPLFQATGMALLTSIGGASGAVFGTLFRGGAKRLAGQEVFDALALADFLQGGLEAVQQRGGAKPGDKTMVDVLHPAVQAAAGQAGQSLGSALHALAAAAELSVENTRSMVATVGKAKTLGERSLGYPDPGAISMALLLKFMGEYVDSLA